MSNHTVTFSELASRRLIEVGAGRPRTVNSGLYPDLAILRVADVLDGSIRPSLQGNTADAHRKAREPKISRSGDVVLTVKGTVGRVALISTTGPDFAYSPQLCYFRPVDDGPLRPRYLYYWFKSAEFWIQANALKGQTDMADYISLSDIEALRIRIPSLEEQAAIADLLGALDDKIAVNEHIASTSLELTSSLFENFLVRDSEVEDSRLGAVAGVNLRKVRPKDTGSLRYVDIASVSVDHIEWPNLSAWADAPSRARRGAVAGDTIWSTVRPNRRSRALVLDDDPDLVVSTGFAVLSPQQVGPAFLYETTRRDGFVQYLESVAEGSAYPAVRADRFEKAPISVLSPSIMASFEKQAMTIHHRAHAAKRESRNLAALRDTLLPRLMSGDIKVRDAEKVVEEAV